VFFQATGPAKLRLEVSTPGSPKRPVPDGWFAHWGGRRGRLRALRAVAPPSRAAPARQERADSHRPGQRASPYL